MDKTQDDGLNFDFGGQPEQKQPDMGGSQQPADAPPKDAASEQIAAQTESQDDNPLKAQAWGGFGDLVQGVKAGVDDAVRGTREGVRAIERNIVPENMQDEGIDETLKPSVEKPESISGKVAEDLTHVMLGFLGGKFALKGLGIATEGVKGAAAASAVGTGMTSDPNAQRLSNMLSEVPWLEPIFSTLKQDPTDSVLVSKAKAMVEDVAVSTTAAVLFKGIHVAAIKAYEMAGGKVTPKLTNTVQAELGQALKDHEASLSAKASTNGSNGFKDTFKPNLDAPDMDLAMARPGTKDLGKQTIGFDQIRYGHDLNTEAGQKSIGKYQRKLLEEPGTIPQQIVTKNADGTFTIVSGNGRQKALELAGHDSAEYRVIEEAGVRQEAQKTIGDRVNKIFSPNGDEMIQMKPKVQQQLKASLEKIAQADRSEPGTLPNGYANGHVKGEANQMHLNGEPGHVGPMLDVLSENGKIIRQEAPELASKSDEEISNLAKLAALDGADQLGGRLRILRGALDDAPQVAEGARITMQNLHYDTFAAARKALFTDDEVAWKEALAAGQQGLQFQADLTAVATGFGRGLRVFGKDVGPMSAEEFEKLMSNKEARKEWAKAIIATEGDAEKISELNKLKAAYAKLTTGQKVMGAHNELWMGLGLLSRFTTQAANIGSTALNVLAQPASMVAGGMWQGFVRRDWSNVRQGFAIYNGMRTALFDSFELAARAAKTGESILSPSSSIDDKMKYISSMAFNKDPNSMMGRFLDLAGNFTRLSFRGLTAGDEFFKQLSYRAKVSAQASLQAADLVKQGAMQPKEIKAYVQNALQQSISKAGKGLDEGAMAFADKGAFTSDLKGDTWFKAVSIGEIMANAAGNPLVRGTLLPFVKTPTNVTRTTFEYTPVIGQLRKQFWSDIAAGGEKQAMAMGKLTLGSGMYMGAMYLALDGRITGAPPPPGVQTPPGYKPYSIVIFNEDGTPKRYIPYQRMQPFGDILGLAYDFGKVTGMLDVDKSQGIANAMVLAMAKVFDPEEGFANLRQAAGVGSVVSYSNSLISKTYLRSLSEFFSVFGGYNSEAKAERWIDNKIASYVPGMISQFNNDTEIREVRGMLDAIYAKIPGLSQTLPAKRDYLGEVRDVPFGLPWSLVVPSQISDAKNDPVMNELSRLAMSDGQVKFGYPDKQINFQGKKWDLTKLTKDGVSAYDRLQEIMETVKPMGETKNFRSKLEEVIHDPNYKLGQDLPVMDGTPQFPGMRTRMVKAEEAKYRRAALDQVLSEYREQLGVGNLPIKFYQEEDKANRKLSSWGQNVMDLAK